MECQPQKNIKTLFGTVIYDAALKYKDEFINSINAQTTDSFELLIINDNVSVKEINSIKQKILCKTEIIQKPREMSIAELRVFLIEQAKKKNCQLLVLGDFDDTFQENRIASIQNHFCSKFEFYYNNLCTMDNVNVFKYLPETCEDISCILERNFLGLSTTALNLEKLSDSFIHSLYECDIPVFDWYLFLRLLLSGKKGLYIKSTATFYRIHENNIAGLLEKNEANLKKELQIKLKLYSLLSKYSPLIDQIYKKYTCIQTEAYISYINPNIKGFWWNNIQIYNREDK